MTAWTRGHSRLSTISGENYVLFWCPDRRGVEGVVNKIRK